MVRDILETLFASHMPSLAGSRKQQDPYHWLEDSSDEDDIPRPINTTGMLYPPSSKNKTLPPTAVIDLTNSNGKRTIQDTSSAQIERDAKRMRVENSQRQQLLSNGQAEPTERHITIDLSVSPPPVHRTGPQPPQQQIRSANFDSLAKDSRMNQNHNISPMFRTHDTSPNTKVFKPTWPFPKEPVITSLPSEKQSNASTAQRTQAPAAKEDKSGIISYTADKPAIVTTSGPFEIDDSSDDEPQNNSHMARSAARDPRLNSGRPQLSSTQRERQVLASRKRRQEAAERKRDTPISIDTHEKVDGKHSEVMSVNRSARLPWDDIAAHSSKITDRSKVSQSHQHFPSPARDSLVDLTGDCGSSHTAKYRHESKKDSLVRDQTHIHPVDDMSRRNKERAEANRNAQLQAHIQRLDEKERKGKELKKAAEGKKRAQIEEQELAKSKLREEHEKQLKAKADAAQRSARRVALNKLEAEQEAQAKKIEQDKRLREQREWEERLKAQKAQREAQRQRQAEVEKNKGHLDERQAALSRLGAIRPPSPPPSKDVACFGAGETDINKTVSKHSAPSGLHFKDDNGSLAADAARRKVKEIQDRNAQKGLLETKAKPTLGQASKEQNTRKKEAANQIWREAVQKKVGGDDDGELIREEDGDAKPPPPKHGSSGPTFASSLALPKGPQSLSSVAGQALLARANTKPTAPSDGASQPSASKHTGHTRKLGEILPEDVQLVRWRDAGMKLSEVEVLFAKRFGGNRVSSTLSKRYRQVRDALRCADVEEHILDMMIVGSKEAAEKVNRAVHGRWPLDENDDAQRDSEGHFLPAHERQVIAQERRQQPTPAPTASFASTISDDTLTHEDEIQPRPTTGGKQINAQSMAHWFGQMYEIRAESEPDPPSAREPSPITEDDYVHFGYQVERRELSQEHLDEGWEIEDEMWQVCDEPLDQLKKANTKTSNEAMTIPKKWKDLRDENPEFDLKLRNLRDGRRMYTVYWAGLGQVQTRSVRFKRYHHDGILPRSKDGWAPKTCYHVFKRAIEKSGDDIFSPSKQTDTTSIVYKAAFTTLEEANTMAIRHFVALTFTSPSANLTKRSMEAKSLEEGLEEDLLAREEEAGEEVCFKMEIETEGEGRAGRVEIWVEEGKLRGQRNL